MKENLALLSIENRLTRDQKWMYSQAKELYSNDPKAYHTIEHINTLLALFERFYPVYKQSYRTEGCLLSLDEDFRLENQLFLSILFHDCVYLPGLKDAEELSAETAEEMMERWAEEPVLGEKTKTLLRDKQFVKEVKSLILSTKISAVQKTSEEKFLHDLDWSGFATLEQMMENEEKIFYEARLAGYLLSEAHRAQMEFYLSLMKNENKPIFLSVFGKYDLQAKENIRERVSRSTWSV